MFSTSQSNRFNIDWVNLFDFYRFGFVKYYITIAETVLLGADARAGGGFGG